MPQDNGSNSTDAAPQTVQTPLPGVEEDMTGTEKYLLLKVPEFAVDPLDSSRRMTSYLRIGAHDQHWDSQPGADLELLVHAGGPPGGRVERDDVSVVPPQPGYEDRRLVRGYRTATGEIKTAFDTLPSTGNTEIWIVNENGAYREATAADFQAFAPFVDDNRVRDLHSGVTADKPHADGHNLSTIQRHNESSVLHTRGGWRDHSDGNRITTTYGDKIEVIRGNYKMIVLGRQDDPSIAAGWDASGNHIQDFGATMPGASVRVEWVRDDKLDAWHLFNTTEGVIQSSTKGGNFYDFTWGEHVESTTGTEKPYAEATAALIASRVQTAIQNAVKGGRPAETARTEIGDQLRREGYDLTYALEMKRNPKIVEKKWADSIESYLGSTLLPIPTVTEESHVTTKTSTSHVTTSTETSYVTTSTETTHVDTSTTTSHIGTEVATTYADALVDTTFVGAQNSTTIAGVTNEIAIVGAASEIGICGGKMAIDIAHYVFELVIAGKLGINIGVSHDIKIGAFNEVSIPDTKKVALQKLTTVLDESITTLTTKKTSLTRTTTCLTNTVKALQTYLGS